MAVSKVNQLLFAAIFMAGTLSLASTRGVDSSEAKLTLQQKVAAVTSSNKNIQENTIPGSSDYVPESGKHTSSSQLVNFKAGSLTTAEPNTTNSQANVFEATASANVTSQKDPLLVNAQSPNPFLSNVPGGMNPRIAMMLQNNPRLQMLARQNPIVAQQIMRNPGLLRDPQIQRAIQSQLSPGQGQNLLGQLGQGGLLNGLGRALNPLGLPLGINPALLNRQQQGNQMNRLGQNQLHQNQNGNNFGLPRAQQPTANPHRETLPGGYYGNNDNNNAVNPSVEDGVGGNESDEGADQGNAEGAADNGNQDYDGNTGAGEEDPNAGADDSQQNPAEDPDIQQLQNFGGPVNDNFPEGLFPPGLLSQEDINEIRKQQEKQAKEAEERERQQQQQQQQDPQGQGSADYEDTGDDGSAANGEEVPAEGAGTEGAEEGANEVDDGAVQGHEQPEGGATPVVNNQAGFVGANHQGYGNPTYGNAGYSPNLPAQAFKNSYQPVQPLVHQPRVQLQPSIDYANDYPNSGVNHQLKNQLSYQPGVQYDNPNGQQYNNYQPSTTPYPISQQYGRSGGNPLLNNFNGPPQPAQFGGYRPQHQHTPQPVRPWPAQQPFNHNGGFNADPRALQVNQSPPLGALNHFNGNNNIGLSNDEPYTGAPFSTPTPLYRSNMFNNQRPAFQQRPRGYLD